MIYDFFTCNGNPLVINPVYIAVVGEMQYKTDGSKTTVLHICGEYNQTVDQSLEEVIAYLKSINI